MKSHIICRLQIPLQLDRSRFWRLVKGLTLSQMINCRLSKLKEFADCNFEYNENGGKLSKTLQNSVGKGEIARHEQFLLFPPCFQKTCTPGK